MGEAPLALRFLACTHPDEVVSAGSIEPLMRLHRTGQREAYLALKFLGGRNSCTARGQAAVAAAGWQPLAYLTSKFLGGRNGSTARRQAAVAAAGWQPLGQPMQIFVKMHRQDRDHCRR